MTASSARVVDLRIPFTGGVEDFDWTTDAAGRAAKDNPDNIFGAVLGLLDGCESSRRASVAEKRGASYAQLVAVADAVGMSPEQLENWILLAESVAISERHALCILSELTDVAA